MILRFYITFFVFALPYFSQMAGANDTVSFGEKVRPLLSDRCFQCHGPDEHTRKGGLRLDLKEGAYTVISPGNADESEIVRRIFNQDPDEMMPPHSAEKPLSEVERDLLRAWVEQGAPWDEHWAFVAPKRPALPQVAKPEWVKNPVDHFVLSRLEKEGLAPSPQADRATLLRRLSLDIVGLTPTLEEQDRAMRDSESEWYGNAVERLLASPHYGEHWARYWMDAAQYADSDGYEKDKPREAWSWRDWVVQAFNSNMPYDRFVVEQVAGDLLPNATLEQRIATGYLRNSMINEEGGIDPEQFRMEGLYNRLDIIGRSVLGLTLQCAQCHTHKYDPLSHVEYYQMLSFLNGADEACIPVYSKEEQEQQETLATLTAELESEIKQEMPDWQKRMADWERESRKVSSPNWHPLDMAFDDTASGGQKFTPQGDGSYLAEGYAPTMFHPKMTAPSPLSKITAVRIEQLTDTRLPRGGPGRSIYGSAALSEFELRVTSENIGIKEYDKWTLIKLVSAISDVNPHKTELGPEFPSNSNKVRWTGPVEFAIDGNHDTAWSTDVDPVRRNQPWQAIFKLETPLETSEGAPLALRLSQVHGGHNSNDNQNYSLGRFRISVTDAEELPKAVLPASISQILDTPPSKRSDEDQFALFHHWRGTEKELSQYNRRIDSLLAAYPNGSTQLTLEERDAPRETRRLDRGDFLSPAEVVQAAVPAFLHPLEQKETAPRLAFAEWLVSKNSPTTGRAFANRVWQRYFANGLVRSSADLGMQGEAPSHPELLDWLAVEFMESGWDIKHLHRLIVHSASYQQSSLISPELYQRDPENILLARGARFRVEAETVRDIALGASGLLNPRLGGPSVYTPAPEYLFMAPASYGDKVWNTELAEDKYRRSLYTFQYRSVPFPVMQVFDAPAGDAPCTRREISNSPLQALATLNEPLFFESAARLAMLVLREGGADDTSRLSYAFRRCAAREPDIKELDLLTEYLNAQRARIQSGQLDPAALLQTLGSLKLLGDKPDSVELAAWTLTARALLNLDETITRQ